MERAAYRFAKDLTQAALSGIVGYSLSDARGGPDNVAHLWAADAIIDLKHAEHA